jgi:hypothetical protein
LLEDVNMAGLSADGTTIYVASYSDINLTHNRQEALLLNMGDRRHALKSYLTWPTLLYCSSEKKKKQNVYVRTGNPVVD